MFGKYFFSLILSLSLISNLHSQADNHYAYASNTSSGNQAYPSELGMEFRVNNFQGIFINQLGAFDDQGNGITGTENGGVRVAIFDKATQLIVPGLDVTIKGLQGTYTSYYRMVDLSQTVNLPVGEYVIVAKGYNSSELNGNFLSFPLGDSANGAVNYIGTAIYGSIDRPNFSYPNTYDAGPANRYLAGNFRYTTIPVSPTVNDTISGFQSSIDLYKIQAAYNNLTNTAFTLKYILNKSDNISTIVDSASTNYDVHLGMMKGHTNNTDVLFNTHYFLVVNNEDSVININSATASNPTLQLHVFDSVFTQANVQGFQKSLINDSTYKIKMLFNPNSYYKNYEVTYNDKYLIKSIVIEYPDTEYDEDGNPPPAGRINIMHMMYNNYHSETLDISIFDEGKYIRRNEYGQFIGVNGYSSYQIIGNLQQYQVSQAPEL